MTCDARSPALQNHNLFSMVATTHTGSICDEMEGPGNPGPKWRTAGKIIELNLVHLSSQVSWQDARDPLQNPMKFISYIMKSSFPATKSQWFFEVCWTSIIPSAALRNNPPPSPCWRPLVLRDGCFFWDRLLASLVKFQEYFCWDHMLNILKPPFCFEKPSKNMAIKSLIFPDSVPETSFNGDDTTSTSIGAW